MNTDRYSAEALAARLAHRGRDIGTKAAIDELRDALAQAEWLVGQRDRSGLLSNPARPAPIASATTNR